MARDNFFESGAVSLKIGNIRSKRHDLIITETHEKVLSLFTEPLTVGETRLFIREINFKLSRKHADDVAAVLNDFMKSYRKYCDHVFIPSGPHDLCVLRCQDYFSVVSRNDLPKLAEFGVSYPVLEGSSVSSVYRGDLLKRDRRMFGFSRSYVLTLYFKEPDDWKGRTIISNDGFGPWELCICKVFGNKKNFDSMPVLPSVAAPDTPDAITNVSFEADRGPVDFSESNCQNITAIKVSSLGIYNAEHWKTVLKTLETVPEIYRKNILFEGGRELFEFDNNPDRKTVEEAIAALMELVCSFSGDYQKWYNYKELKPIAHKMSLKTKIITGMLYLNR